MQKYRAIRHAASGFTLIEMMVTVAVLAILAFAVTPSIQQFIAKSEMNALQNDFLQSINRAKAEAVSRNTCVTMCQMASASACNTTAAQAGQWQQGWILFENPTCSALSTTQASNLVDPAVAALGVKVLHVRQPRQSRFELKDEPGSTTDKFMFNAQGQMVSGALTLNLRDQMASNSPNARDIVLNRQGRPYVVAANTGSDTIPDDVIPAAGNTSTSGGGTSSGN